MTDRLCAIAAASAYLLAALAAGARGIYLWLDCVNGRPWSWWPAALLVGAALLIIASGLNATGHRHSCAKLAIIGSAELAFFYVPAFGYTIGGYLASFQAVPATKLLGPAAEFIAVIGSLGLAIVVLLQHNREAPRSGSAQWQGSP